MTSLARRWAPSRRVAWDATTSTRESGGHGLQPHVEVAGHDEARVGPGVDEGGEVLVEGEVRHHAVDPLEWDQPSRRARNRRDRANDTWPSMVTRVRVSTSSAIPISAAMAGSLDGAQGAVEIEAEGRPGHGAAAVNRNHVAGLTSVVEVRVVVDVAVLGP